MSEKISRRRFLGQASCAAVGSVGLLSTLLNLRLAGATVGQGLASGDDDYRALVCLYFAGGMDSYNFLLPSDPVQHAIYAATRGGIFDQEKNPDGLALARESVLALPSSAYADFALGLHPRCGDNGAQAGLSSLFAQGHLALLPNVGTLVERVSKENYDASAARLPRGLFSHSDQMQQWQTSVPTETRGLGWAGLAADILQAESRDAKVSMNISTSGNNIWQTGNRLFAYTIGETGALLPHNYNSPRATPDVGMTGRTAIRTAGIDNLLQQEYQNLFDRTFAANLRDSIDAGVEFSDAFAQTALTTPFPGDADYAYPPGLNRGNDPARFLAAQFKSILRTMQAREALGLRRQTFFINYGGWDHHDEVIANMDQMMDIVNRCLASYWAALGEIGLREKVTLFSASDFGRTLTSNGRGSDHAWGGNHFVLGGAVAGGRVYGPYPDLSLDGPSIVTHRAVTLPHWSVDEYFAELALWLGVPAGRLDEVLPRVREFYAPGGAAPIGFMRV